MYNEVLRENDELRRKSEKMATQHNLMKARVKEWSAWVAKDRAKRTKGQKGKSAKGSHVDMDVPPTPASTTSPFTNGQKTPQPGGEGDDMHQQIAEQASRFLEQHENSSRGNGDVGRSDHERAGSPSSHILSEDMENDLPQAPLNFQSKQVFQKATTEVSSNPRTPQSDQTNVEDTHLQARRTSPRVTSSQTTQDADDVHEQMGVGKGPIDQRPSNDDEPTIVSERSLKRKHAAPIEVYKDPPERYTEPPPCIKDEIRNTQAAPHVVPALLNRASTIDLDEVRLHIETPRKRRRMREIIRISQLGSGTWSNPRPGLRHERSSSLPLALAQQTGAQMLVKEEHRDENVVLEVPDSDPTHAIEGDGGFAGASEVVLTRGSRDPRKVNALRNRDVNSQVQPELEHLHHYPRRPDDEGRGAKAVPMLSEDGEETQIPEPSPAKMEESRRRFTELYDNPPPEKKVLASPRTPASGRLNRMTTRASAVKKSDRSTPKPQRTPAPKSSKKKKTPNTHLPTPQTSTRTTRSADGIRSFHQQQQKQKNIGPPLRTRRLSQLQLSDFKINPNTNAGLDIAYNEVVRSREARRCLPGCTKTECCGRDLRAMVEAGLNPPLPRSFWDDSQSGRQQTYANEQEGRDHEYLQWFMGNGYDHDRVDTMPTAMRQDLVVQAKVKLLANQAGKHRQAHQRSRTPPGFWRTDFPATQEMEKDREEARKREREAVEERWREAMIEDGRWLFRDE